MNNKSQGGNQHPANYSAFINGALYHFNEPEVTAEDLLNKVKKSPVSCFSVWQGLEGCDFRFIRPDEKVDLRNIGPEVFRTKDPVSFEYQVNDQPETTELGAMTPLQIMKCAAIDSDDNYLVQLINGEPEELYAWSPEVAIKMVCGSMKFVTRPWVLVADIEALGKKCQPVPVAKQYRVKIQNGYHLVDSPYLSEDEIIRIGGKHDVDCWNVLMFLSNQAEPVKIEKGAVVDLLRPCILYFVLQPKQQTEGSSVRSEFSLPLEDQSFLNAQGLLWETLRSPHGNCLLVHEVMVPAGYNVDKVQVGLMIPTSYPASEIDMAYFHPALQLKDGRAIAALTTCEIDGRVFQRWSRHRAAGQWIPGVDNIATHLFLVKNWLIKEINGSK